MCNSVQTCPFLFPCFGIVLLLAMRDLQLNLCTIWPCQQRTGAKNHHHPLRISPVSAVSRSLQAPYTPYTLNHNLSQLHLRHLSFGAAVRIRTASNPKCPMCRSNLQLNGARLECFLEGWTVASAWMSWTTYLEPSSRRERDRERERESRNSTCPINSSALCHNPVANRDEVYSARYR